MKKTNLEQSVLKFKTETRDALQLLFNNVNKGQRKQLIKKEEILHLFDTYGVNYDDT